MTQRSVATCLMMILLATTLMVNLVGCSSSRDALDQPVHGITVVRQITGSDPALTATGAMLITSADELMATKSKELLKLDVKFETESLVVVSLGEQPTSGYWAWISGVQKQGDDLWVQGTANRPDKTQKVTAALSYPFAAVVIEKTSAALVHPEMESVVGQPLPDVSPKPVAAATKPAEPAAKGK